MEHNYQTRTHQQKVFFVSPNICTVITHIDWHIPHDFDALQLCIITNFLPLSLKQKLLGDE